MKKILLIHGANLNHLGKRDPEQYGTMTLQDLEVSMENKAEELDFDLSCFQSNHEGALIDYIQENSANADAMIINPGAFTHYSYALYDAIIDSNLPTVEVHLSNIKEREPWRAHSVIEPACAHSIMGKKIEGYFEALHYLRKHLDDN